jgi:hypothetical protein
MIVRTKLNIGDRVWVMDSNKPLECTVERIETICFGSLISVKYTARRGESAGARAEFHEEEYGKRYFASRKRLIRSLLE